MSSVPHDITPLASVSMVSHETSCSSLSPPFSIRIPLPNVEVAVVLSTSRTAVENPPVKEEVAVELLPRAPVKVPPESAR